MDIKVPVLPESVADALLLDWKKQVGDAVRRDEILVEVETDKIVLEVVAPTDGVLADIFEPSGSTVTAGQRIAQLNEGAVARESGDVNSNVGGADNVNANVNVDANDKPSVDTPAQIAQPSSGETDADDEPLSPAVRRLVGEHGLDVNAIRGSGRNGRVTKEDVLTFIANQVAPDEEAASASSAASASAPAPSPSSVPASSPSPARDSMESAEVREPMSRLRQTIAARLVQAQHEAALLTTFNEVDMQPVMTLRAKYKEDFEKRHGARLGFMSFFVKAAVGALQKYPTVNARIDANDIVHQRDVDIGIAVSSPRGLVVPVLRDCESLSFADIEKRIRQFGESARDGKLGLDELQGGTFTITNGGVFGSLLSTPIVNPPQSAILGMHKIQERPIAEHGAVVIRPMMYLALTYDHRIIDGQQAVGFLVAIKETLEDPAALLLQS